MRPLYLVVYLAGAIEGLLLARLVLKLFAARPDNPAFGLLFALTAPLVAPFAALDAAQPRFGAVLEYSTLAAIVVLAALISAAAWRARRRPGASA
jgi:uncharacterized protein YggT (Ycf19 family)